MKNVSQRVLSMFICLAFLAGMAFIPTPFALRTKADSPDLSGTLGSQWSVGWNKSSTPAGEFVKIASDIKKTGAYSLKVGHPLEDTEITLKLQIPVEKVQTYQYSLYAMAPNGGADVALYARDGANGSGYGNILEYIITDGLSDSWALFQNSDNDGNATEITVDSGVFCLDLAVSCPAGTYVYFDNIDVFATAEPAVQLNFDSSFERWYGSNYTNNHNIDEFVTIVSDKSSSGGKSMRLGSAKSDTNIVLKRYIPTVIGRTSSTNYINFDYYIELPDASGNITDYFTTATVTMKGYSPKTSTANKVFLDLTKNEDAKGAWVPNDSKSNLAWCGGEAREYLYVEINVYMKAGAFIYFDNIAAGTRDDSTKLLMPNILFNGSFEEDIDFNPISDIVVEEEMPDGWYLGWTSIDTRQHFLTKNAYDGTRALFLSALEVGNEGYTISQSVEGLTAGETYAFEAYVRKHGDFASARFFRNDHNADKTVAGGNSNISMVSDFPDSEYTQWTKLSGTFVPTDNDTVISIYFNSNLGGWMAVDNVAVYKQSDESKKNLVTGGGFEPVVENPETPITSTLANPDNWTVSWNDNVGYRYLYRSHEANTGDYALTLWAKDKPMNHTLKQSIADKVEVGAEYTFEGYFKKIGSFNAISLLETSPGAGNVTFKQLKDVRMSDYTFVSATFVARANSAFNIYTSSSADALLLADDLKIYRSDDQSKTNILENGGFEGWSASNQEQYRINKTFAQQVTTVNATVKIPAGYNGTEDLGVITGNYNGTDESFNLEVTANGNPRVYIMDNSGKAYDLVFDGTDLRTGEWTDISVTKNADTVSLFVDGADMGSKEFTASLDTCALPYAISGDNVTTARRYSLYYSTGEPTNPDYFKGEIKNVSFYNADTLIASYDMWEMLDAEIIADGSDNGYYAIRYGNFIKELQAEDNDATEYPYSFVALGDTQYVCERDKKSGTDDMSPIFDWIVNNKENKNIQFVMGLGDITDETSDGEYAIAKNQYKKLQNAGIRYSIIKGNHDGIFGYDTEDGNDPTRFDEYLADGYTYDGICEAPVFDEGGNLISGTIGSTYHKIEVAGQKWLVLALDYNASADTFAWANGVISSNPDYRVIITTHGYINGNLEWGYLDKSDYASGEYIWTNLASLHENVEMVICGHYDTVDIASHKRVGVNGNVVTELLIDRQTIDQSEAYGHVTLLRFSADGKEIKVEDFTTAKEKYFRPTNQFVLDIDPDATENDAALFNFEDYLVRNGIYSNKNTEFKELLASLKQSIANAQGSVAVNDTYNAAINAVITPDAPVVDIIGNTATIAATDGCVYSMDGINWQVSPSFTDLPYDTALTFYQRKAAQGTEIASLSSDATKCMIVSAPVVLAGETSIYVKPTEGFEYSIDNVNWQTSNVFNDGIINGQTYTVYQRPINSAGIALTLNTVSVTADGEEKSENPSAGELAKLRAYLISCNGGNNAAMDYNGDYTVNLLDLVNLKKQLANKPE